MVQGVRQTTSPRTPDLQLLQEGVRAMTTRERSHEPSTAIPFKGTHAEFLSLLDQTKKAGLLVSATRPKPTADGTQVTATVRMRDHAAPPVFVQPKPQPATPAKPAAPTWRPWALAAVCAVPCLVSTGYMAGLATRTAVITALPYVGAGLAVVIALWFLLGRTGRCVGIHCPGCGH
jgi:hypothetical protein